MKPRRIIGVVTLSVLISFIVDCVLLLGSLNDDYTGNNILLLLIIIPVICVLFTVAIIIFINKRSKQSQEKRAEFLSLSKDEVREYIKTHAKYKADALKLAQDWRENHQSVDSLLDDKVHTQNVQQDYQPQRNSHPVIVFLIGIILLWFVWWLIWGRNQPTTCTDDTSWTGRQTYISCSK